MKETPTRLERIETYGRTLNYFLIFFSIVAAVALLIQIALIVWAAVAPQTIADFGFTILADRSGLGIVDAANGALPTGEVLAMLITNAVTTLIVLAMLLFGVRFFRDMVANHTPFGKHQVNRLKAIGILILFLAVTRPLLDLLLTKLLMPERVALLDFAAPFMMTLITGLVFLCLAYVFEYGTVLQIESDETL